jgi:hypothetical protein
MNVRSEHEFNDGIPFESTCESDREREREREGEKIYIIVPSNLKPKHMPLEFWCRLRGYKNDIAIGLHGLPFAHVFFRNKVL